MSQGMQFKRRQYNELKLQVEKLQKEINLDDAKKGDRITLEDFSTSIIEEGFDYIFIQGGGMIKFNEIPLLVKFLKAVAGKHGVKVE